MKRERWALVNGSVAELGNILPKKEAALKELRMNSVHIQSSDLQSLVDNFSVNQKLYSAVQSGLSSAYQHLSALREPTTDLCTYDARGKVTVGARVSQGKKF